MTESTEIQSLRKRLTILGAVGMPFYAAFALGSAAHFKGKAILPVLENEATAYQVFIVGALGAAIGVVLSLYIAWKIKSLENAGT